MDVETNQDATKADTPEAELQPPAADQRDVVAAVKILAQNLEKAGIQISTPNSILSKTRPEKGCNRLTPQDSQLVKSMVEIGILGAMYAGKATLESVGKEATKSALVPGNVVALHWENNMFARIKNGVADFGGGPRGTRQLPYWWDLERFLVVDAGDDHVAFFSPGQARFLTISSPNGSLGASEHIHILDECPRPNESFVATDESVNEKVKLLCPSAHRSHSRVTVVQIVGFGSGEE